MKIQNGGVRLILKQRVESKELRTFRALNARMSLLEKERNYCLNLEKGFVGELDFDLLVSQLSNEKYLALNDLIYDINSKVFQIDSLLISNNTVYLFEVKNYEGDFYIEKDRWYSVSDTEIQNPILQLQRAETLILRLLKEIGFSGIVRPFLIFINPEFHLYNAPRNPQIIFPSQLNRFVNELSFKMSGVTSHDRKISKHLLSLHLKESPYSRIPKYTYEQLNKGIYCPCCHTFFTESLVCSQCGYIEEYSGAIFRSIIEFNLLFPEERITTKAIWEWCGQVFPKKSIRNTLLSKFKMIGYGKSSYFIIKD
ncbi:hypothetical protein J2Z26_000460 [Bacillus luteolus]|nr:hypothetical protein [Cytobacillus luteolus]